MPRGPRLDAPGVLHHVMVRSIEGGLLFRDDGDRLNFVKRLAALVPVTRITVYAWALLPDHAHLLLRTGLAPLSRLMRRLLTGYAGTFNRRHRRRGHVFQNRYKSIVVEEEPYFLELVRYLHLNPLRAGVVADVDALARYPWSGHATLLGHHPRTWQSTEPILARFGERTTVARKRYIAYLCEGVARGRRPELQGGGLRRSLGGWQAVPALRRGREGHAADERILGSDEFVMGVLEAAEGHPHGTSVPPLCSLVNSVCAHLRLPTESLQGTGHRRAVARAREGIAYLWIEQYGQSARPLAERFGVGLSAIHKAARRGSQARKEWEGLAGDGQDT